MLDEIDVKGDDGTERSEERSSESTATFAEKATLFLVMALVIVLDQITKRIVEGRLALNESWTPFAGIGYLFQITHVGNTGAAFGLFRGAGDIFTAIAIFVAVAIVIYNHRLPGNQRLLRLAMGLQMGGALGNLIDRLRQGHVTDFLDFGPVPVFNLSDTSIVSGAIVLALLMLLEGRRQAEGGDESPATGETAAEQGSASHDAGMLWNE